MTSGAEGPDEHAEPEPDSSDPELEQALDEFFGAKDDPAVQVDPSLLLAEPGSPSDADGAASRLIEDLFSEHGRDRYRQVAEVARGGMGSIWRVWDAHLRRTLAMKVVLGKDAGASGRPARVGPRRLARFLQEAQITGQLDHPGVVPVHELGQDAKGNVYFTMRLVRGRDLREVFRLATAGDEEWSLVRVLGVLQKVCQTMAYAHDKGVIHRDLKPSNVMVGRYGEVYVMDWGLARVRGAPDTRDLRLRTQGRSVELRTSRGDAVEDDPDSPLVTVDGAAVGTPFFMPPEQAEGRVEELGPPSDVYAVGAMLYQLLTGRMPYDTDGESPSPRGVVARVAQGPPRPVRDLARDRPAELVAICEKAMARDPGARYPTMRELAADLGAYLEGRVVRAHRTGIVVEVRKWVARNKALSAEIVAAVVLVIGTFGGKSYVEARERRGDAVSCTEEGERSLAQSRVEVGELNGLLDSLRDLAADPRAEDRIDRIEDLREEIERQRIDVRECYADAREHLLAAFQHVARWPRARRGLADLFADQLRQELREMGDLYDRARVAELEQELRRLDDEGRYAPLLRPVGSVTLSSDGPGDRIAVGRDDGAGPIGFDLPETTPRNLEDLPEGSYVARFTRPGFADAVVPFLVRRDACYDEPDAKPPRELTVEMIPLDLVPEGFVYVPGGWTLVEDDPPRWEHVPSFLIQRLEWTYGDWISWMNAVQWHPTFVALKQGEDHLYRPRYGNSPREHHVWCLRPPFLPLDRWMPGPEAPLDWPVRGLGPVEMRDCAASLNALRPPPSPAWYYDLPRRSEWIRAARGADARRYPWGDDFDWEWCAGFLTGGADEHEPSPYPVGTFPEDCSPFDVRDLAGSVAEVTHRQQSIVPGTFDVCGGSYREADRTRMAVTTPRSERNEPQTDVGFRPVLRRVPDEALYVPERPASFRDDFEHGDLASRSWVLTVGTPLELVSPLLESVRFGLEDGRLVCEGGEEDYSHGAIAWHPVHVSMEGWSVSATMSMTARSKGSRGFGIDLVEDFRTFSTHGPLARLTLVQDGEPRLEIGLSRPPKGDAHLDPEGEKRFELRTRGRRLEGRIWDVGDPRPVEPLLEETLPAGSVPRFVGLGAPNYVGARVEIEEVEVDPFQ